MGEFRRFVIGIVEGLQILFIVGTTIAGGWVGWRLLQIMGYSPYGLQIAERPAVEILFPVLGAIGGFFLSATSAAIFFMLAEIAANTRTTSVMLEELAGARRAANYERTR